MEPIKTYSYDEAFKASLDYFNGNELPAKVFVDKYALKDNNNNILEDTPDKMHRRLAKEFARIESKKFKKPYSENFIYDLLKNYKTIIPQGSPLYGIGNPYQYISISNCFVIDSPVDSYGGILKADEELIQISKRRGGVGVDLSNPRPIRTPTHNSSKTSTGLASWMERYSNSIREVGQDGRRGALMQTISVHHPEILTFVKIKNDDTKITGANISIRLSDEFLKAVEEGTTYEQRWPVDSDSPTISQYVDARSVWKEIIHSAWLRAEPGLLFWDNILRESIPDCYSEYRTVSTNPCGEIPLSPYDSCRLLAINLFSCVVDPYTKDAYFDYGKLYHIAQIAQRLMDNLVDLELECIDRIIDKIDHDPESVEVKQKEKILWLKIRRAAYNGRRTGLGITALGDVLAAIGLKYGSEESIREVDKIYKTLKFGSYRSSVDMAKELGPFFMWDWNLEKKNPFINRIREESLYLNGDLSKVDKFVPGVTLYEDIKKYGRRNIANLTTAPTGTISTQASLEIDVKATNVKKDWNIYKFFNTTSGIEPAIFTDYIRRKKGNHHDENFRTDFVDQNGDHWQEFKVYHAGVKAWMEVNGIYEIDDTCPYKGSLASEIDWVQRVKLQAAAQKHIDHSISSTINLPNNVTEEEVSKIYTAAWKHGLKGVTVYRDGCRTGVLIQDKKDEKKDRPKTINCNIHHITVKSNKYFVLVGLLDGVPYEVFAGRNGILDKSIKSGKIVRKRANFYQLVTEDDDILLAPITATSDDKEEAITRLTSLSLRSGASIHYIVQQLEKVAGEMHTFARSIARALKEYIPDGTPEGEECPECKSASVVRQSGCKTCTSCGYSACN